jgi:hypothetical protein
MLERLASEERGGLDDDVRSGTDDEDDDGTRSEGASDIGASGVDSLLVDEVEAARGKGNTASVGDTVFLPSAVLGREMEADRDRALW